MNVRLVGITAAEQTQLESVSPAELDVDALGAAYSWDTLDAWAESVAETSGDDVLEVGVDAEYNKVTVLRTTAPEPQAEPSEGYTRQTLSNGQYLLTSSRGSSSIPSDALSIVVDPEAEPPALEATRNDFPPFKAGLRIRNLIDGKESRCSSAFAVRLVDHPDLYRGLTAGHCTRVDNQIYTRTDEVINIGKTKKNWMQRDVTSGPLLKKYRWDIATFSVAHSALRPSGEVFIGKNKSIDLVNIYPRKRYTQGRKVCKSGQATGSTCGLIVRWKRKFVVDDEAFDPPIERTNLGVYKVVGINQVDHNYSAKGDSGGAVFVIRKNAAGDEIARAVGVHVAGHCPGELQPGAGKCFGFFEPIEAVLDEVEATLVTNG